VVPNGRPGRDGEAPDDGEDRATHPGSGLHARMLASAVTLGNGTKVPVAPRPMGCRR
jgi:hypothetical protein